ncbi:Glucagon family neuropeptide [Triplophysa tibetana]|uniref:Glucagon family neuropeptide n=1 Tax=Triplophysa tibetana TaxID=1572043 RepID=A0A5A9PNK5_9TELE|nr:Glucagon family neuropeptide [Triplophysa tibetana]
MMTSSKTTLAFFIYGLLVHCSVCSPLSYPNVRMETEGFEDGNSLPDLTFDSDQIYLPSSPSVTDDTYTLYYPPSKRMERHADGMFNKAYRKALGQMSARKYLHALMAKRVGRRQHDRRGRAAVQAPLGRGFHGQLQSLSETNGCQEVSGRSPGQKPRRLRFAPNSTRHCTKFYKAFLLD